MVALRRLASAAALGLAALALGGCEKLCGPSGIGVFCPETEANPLNHAPVVDGRIVRAPGFICGHVPVGRRVQYSLEHVLDPDGDPLLYEWDLDGDGSFETGGPEVSTIYRSAGTITVRVRVSDFPQHIGVPGEVERTLRVRIVDPARNRPPQAAFSATAPAVAGHAVAFDAGPTTDPDVQDAAGFAYDWDFGDGSFNPSANVVEESLRTVTHVYERPGDYTVRLVVHDCTSGTDDAELRIAVSAPSPSDRAPTARFTSSPAEPLVGQAVTLDGSASTDPNGTIVAYDWDLDGNGTFERTGTSPVTTTSFETAGEHVVGLRVSDDEGLVSAELGSVSVRNNSPPQARFSVFPSSPFVNSPVSLDASPSTDLEGPIARYEWDLDGNGSFEIDAGAAAEHETSFATAGERFVRLRVTDLAGATGIIGHTVVVRSEVRHRRPRRPRRPGGALRGADHAGRRTRRNGPPERCARLARRRRRPRQDAGAPARAGSARRPPPGAVSARAVAHARHLHARPRPLDGARRRARPSATVDRLPACARRRRPAQPPARADQGRGREAARPCELPVPARARRLGDRARQRAGAERARPRPAARLPSPSVTARLGSGSYAVHRRAEPRGRLPRAHGGQPAPLSHHDTEEEAEARRRRLRARRSRAGAGELVDLPDGSEVLVAARAPPTTSRCSPPPGRRSATSRATAASWRAKTTLSTDDLEYFTEVDHVDHEAIGAIDPRDRRRARRGALRARRASGPTRRRGGGDGGRRVAGPRARRPAAAAADRPRHRERDPHLHRLAADREPQHAAPVRAPRPRSVCATASGGTMEIDVELPVERRAARSCAARRPGTSARRVRGVFGLDNLPYGAIARAGGAPELVVRLGDDAVPLAPFERAAGLPEGTLSGPVLNPLLALGPRRLGGAARHAAGAARRTRPS